MLEKETDTLDQQIRQAAKITANESKPGIRIVSNPELQEHYLTMPTYSLSSLLAEHRDLQNHSMQLGNFIEQSLKKEQGKHQLIVLGEVIVLSIARNLIFNLWFFSMSLAENLSASILCIFPSLLLSLPIVAGGNWLWKKIRHYTPWNKIPASQQYLAEQAEVIEKLDIVEKNMIERCAQPDFSFELLMTLERFEAQVKELHPEFADHLKDIGTIKAQIIDASTQENHAGKPALWPSIMDMDNLFLATPLIWDTFQRQYKKEQKSQQFSEQYLDYLREQGQKKQYSELKHKI